MSRDNQLYQIFDAIKFGAMNGVDSAYLAELAACAQTIIMGAECEQVSAWSAAQACMYSIELERGTAAKMV